MPNAQLGHIIRRTRDAEKDNRRFLPTAAEAALTEHSQPGTVTIGK